MKRRQRIQIVTDRLIVRELTARRAGRVADFLRRNRRFHTPWEPTRLPAFFTVGFQRRILRLSYRDHRNVLLFLFLRNEPDRVIGSVTLSNIVRGSFLSCFLGYRLDESCIGQGLMREALVPSLRYTFDHLGLHRVEANVMPENDRSVRLLQRLGFRNEGRAQRYLNIQGRWKDHDHYVMLSEEWYQSSSR